MMCCDSAVLSSRTSVGDPLFFVDFDYLTFKWAALIRFVPSEAVSVKLMICSTLLITSN